MKSAQFDLKKMMERKEEVVKSLTQGIEGLFKRNKIEWVQGEATFKSPTEVIVNGETIKSKSIIIATGSAPIELPFLKFDEKTIVSSTGALSLSKVPDKMVVVGGGVIGLELASVYSRLGSQVEVVEMLDRIIPTMDLAVSRQMLKIMKAQGLSFHLSTKITKGEKKGKKVLLTIEHQGKSEILDADLVLVSIGRRAYTEGLGLKQIGIETTKQGLIPVNGRFQTTHPHIFAIGDVIDGPMLAHKASEEGVVVAELIAGQDPKINYMAIPNVVYTHPEVASVGLTEEEGKEIGLNLITGTYSFKGNPRARCAGDTDGFVKVIGQKEGGKLLGVHIIGPNASEMIGEAVVAIEKRATVAELGAAPHAHPTLSEAIKEAALNALGHAIHL